MKKYALWVLILPIAFALFLAACKGKKSDATAGRAIPVEVGVPVVQDITLSKEYPGYLDADAKVALVGRVNGTLQSINFQAGERVKKGQTLFVIEPTTYEDAVRQAEASLKTAEASLSYAQSSYERMKEAIKSNAVSRIQLLEAESNVAECEASVSNAKAALRTARTNLNYCYIKAPYDGQVDISIYSEGAYIAGAVSPVQLATVYKDDRMYSYFNISDNQWLAQTISDELSGKSPSSDHYVTVRLGSTGERQWEAKLDYLSPNISKSTGTLQVRAELSNPNGLLKSGGYIKITLPYGEAKDAVLIPDASISTDQLGKFIYVVSDSNIVHYRPIITGQLVNDTLRWVKSGLAAGEKYVTKALLKVREGMPVIPIERGTKAPAVKP